ncbi:hypothetical protein CAPTEDRAFT_210921 [Capitella teleta]|uniref:Uncharacterized protein n=1 Tax=Capitella teleta TaxID=283909 RepID=R7VDS4_CAPTE|nr:hypothetical protein CAPTEDRAFT_210921 [Capitella teleta]|eukprot:ELU14466.1 hypothetical protein CAPTEDRAFT_210921 [Capitella teleta]
MTKDDLKRPNRDVLEDNPDDQDDPDGHDYCDGSDDTDGHTYREDHDEVNDRDDPNGYDDHDDHDNPDDEDVPDDHDDHDDGDDPDVHTDRNDHDDSRDDSLDKEPDLRAARARDCFHLPRGNQRILRGQKANVQLANTGGQKFAENKEPESKCIHHCQIANTWNIFHEH